MIRQIKTLSKYDVSALMGILLFIGVCFSASFADAFSANDGFNPDANGRVRALAVQPDGKVLIGGEFTSVNAIGRNRIARLNNDGSLDTDFDPGTGANFDVLAIKVQEDGKILVAGYFTTVNGTQRNRIARLNSNGTLDGSFDPGIGPDNDILTIAVQADGKILIGGTFTNVSGTVYNHIARLNYDGTLDTSFDPGTGADVDVTAIAVQSDGKTLIGGGFTDINGVARNSIARLQSDGSLDTSFDPGTGADHWVLSIGMQVDGKIVIGGYFQNVNGTSRVRVARLNSDGSLDTGFDPGAGASSDVAAVKVQPDGKIVIGGSFTSVGGVVRNRIARLDTDGNLDTGFAPNSGANNGVDALGVQPDGKIVIGGSFTTVDSIGRTRIARFENDGGLDVDFDPGSGATGGLVVALAVQPDGKVLIGGYFLKINGTLPSYLARLNSDGSLDTSFINPNIGSNGYVFAIGVQPDGKIIIGGSFTTVDGTLRNRIARLNSDGSLDTGFDPGNGANGQVHALAVQPDGKVLIGGWFTTVNYIDRNRVARLNSNGSLDATFDPGTGADNSVWALGIQPDGKVLISGQFTSVGGVERNYIARLKSNGSLDTTFDPGTGPNSIVMALAVQPDNKVLIGGLFVTVGGTSRNHIARLNSDGTLDTGFDPGTGTTVDVQTIAVQPDTKVLIGGDFTDVNGIPRNRVARLNSDGTLDTTFDPGTGTNGTVHALAVQPDGKVVMSGGFTIVNGTARIYIARFSLPEEATQSLQAKNRATVTWSRSGSGTVLNNATLEMSSDGVTWTSLGTGQRITGGWQFNGLRLPSEELFYLRARGYYPTGRRTGSGSLTESVHQVYLQPSGCKFFVIRSASGKVISICL